MNPPFLRPQGGWWQTGNMGRTDGPGIDEGVACFSLKKKNHFKHGFGMFTHIRMHFFEAPSFGLQKRPASEAEPPTCGFCSLALAAWGL